MEVFFTLWNCKNLDFTDNNFLYNMHLYRIRRCPVPPPLSSPPVSLGKSWSLTISLKKIILKILELEITSKKIYLIFLFIMYDTAIILLLFLKKFLISLLFIKLSMKLARAISSLSSSVKSDHLESITFSSL